MSAISLISGLLVGAVFVIAGAAKIAQPVGWVAQAPQLGVPTWLAPLVPWWEIVTGAATATGLVAPWPALAALITLSAFTVGIAVLLARDRHPPCACFGAWSSSPVGWSHVARNLVFIGLAVVAVAARS